MNKEILLITLEGPGLIRTALPKFLANKGALINVETSNLESFKWSVVEAVYPQKRRRGRITKNSKKNAKQFDWSGAEFPASLEDVDLFEKNNPNVAVNVLGYEANTFEVCTLRVSEYAKSRTTVNLLLISERYFLINSLSRLVGTQVSKHCGKSHVCTRCFYVFHSEKSMENHLPKCPDGRIRGRPLPSRLRIAYHEVCAICDEGFHSEESMEAHRLECPPASFYEYEWHSQIGSFFS